MKYYLNNPLSNNGIKKVLPEGCTVLDASNNRISLIKTLKSLI
ncbi:MAG: hypothetical protein Q4E33_05635 [Erysipelotrichaceae bacterium]|nr:hypothetical protein [Erysipelotrichaceae bacterium]